MTDTTKQRLSKVMGLGNRLAAKDAGFSRHEAFVQAWGVVKAGGLTIPVKGVTFGNRQEALRRLASYAPDQVRAFIVPEPENPADPAALAVMVGVQNGKGLYRLGFVPREKAKTARALKLTGLRVVSGAWGLGKVTYGARLALAV